MKNLLMSVTACALIFASCTKNEFLDGPSLKDGKIRFSASKALNYSKAAPGHPINSTSDFQMVNGVPGSFRVAGYGTADPINGNRYVNATVTWQPATQSWEYNNEPFWPDHPLNFFAYSPATTSGASMSPVGVDITDFTVKDNNTQVDLLVASALGKTKEQRTPLVFKHALTQIVFKAMKVAGSGLNVKINDVDIVNINNKGTFYSTNAPADHYPQNYWRPTPQSSYSTFNAAPSAVKDGTMSYLVDVEGPAGSVPAKNRGFIKTDPTNNTLLMIPQNFKAWDTQNSITANDNGEKGAYIKLMVKIWTTVDAKVLYLHGTASDFKEIYIPVSSLGIAGTYDLRNDTGTKVDGLFGQWVPGRRINYIITFGDTGSGSGGGGYSEDPTNPTNPPVPVLIPIRFTAEVEEWVDQDVPLLTATFDGKSDDINAKFINGFTDDFVNDIRSVTVPKKYNAKISIATSTPTGQVSTTQTLYWEGLKELATNPEGSLYKFLPFSTITYDFTGIPTANWGGRTIGGVVPLGWTAQAYNGSVADGNKAGLTIIGDSYKNVVRVNGETDNTTADKGNIIVLTRSPWTLAQVKASVEKRAASAVYHVSEAAIGQELGGWTPLYLAPSQTFTIQFASATAAPINLGANWYWNGSDKRATYTQPYHAADMNSLATLLGKPATPIIEYSYYINQDGGANKDMTDIDPNIASGKRLYVVFKSALSGTLQNASNWAIHATNPKIAVYTKP